MRIDFNISKGDTGRFASSCEAVIRNVGRGTKGATVEAINTILTEAKREVPIDTGTLASSIYGGTFRRSDVKGYIYGGIVGFGALGELPGEFTASGIDWIVEPSDPINPKSGAKASTYAVRQHDDLNLSHTNGKAKFLEDPVRNYAATNFARTAMRYWNNALELSNKGVQRGSE